MAAASTAAMIIKIVSAADAIAYFGYYLSSAAVADATFVAYFHGYLFLAAAANLTADRVTNPINKGSNMAPLFNFIYAIIRRTTPIIAITATVPAKNKNILKIFSAKLLFLFSPSKGDFFIPSFI